MAFHNLFSDLYLAEFISDIEKDGSLLSHKKAVKFLWLLFHLVYLLLLLLHVTYCLHSSV